ncbi:MAG: DUF3467 domain-containing protein, partial [Candidatus Kapaibacteriota bacterium]
RILPGVPKAKVFSRIIMSPLHTKLFLNALAENLRKFESQNGEIRIDPGQGPMGNFPGFPPSGTITN